MAVPLKFPLRSPRLPIGGHWQALLAIACILMPYLIYGSLGAGLGVLGVCWWQWPRQIWQQLHRYGFTALAGLMVVSSALAVYPGEAFLQLFNFLPYFALWAAVVTAFSQLRHPESLAQRLVGIMVLGSIPVSVWTLVEYGCKHHRDNVLPAVLAAMPPLDWLYVGNPLDPRAYGLFDSPNTLANYAVMVLGLALGWLLMALKPPSSVMHTSPEPGRDWPGWIIGAIAGLAIALYCSGSRNGYLAAIVLILVWVLSLRTHRWIRYGGLGVLGVIALSAVTFGIGGRQLSWAWVTQDPRIYVWRFALRLIAEKPWLGHGLGSYKLLYDGSVPGYSEMPHAHNLWLSLMVGVGIPATILLTLVIGGILYKNVSPLFRISIWGDAQKLTIGYGLCFLAAMLFSLFDVTLFDARINLLAWLSLAVMDGLRRPELSPSS
jgi:O-antigen ligase